MAEGGYDPCECVYGYEGAMRRLISLLRDSQNMCTDTECLQELPGSNIAQPEAAGLSFALVALFWVGIATVLFLLRPASLRRREAEEKPSSSDSNSHRDPPAVS